MYSINNITTIYVSQKDGNDRNQGFFPENNAMLTGPLKTIEKALILVAEMRSFGAYQPVSIKIVDDEYAVDKTICIDEAVSSVTIEPYKRTLLNGGIRIDNFVDDTFNGTKCVSADLAAYSDLDFSDFYVNGKRAKLTRYPDEGVLYPETVENLSIEVGAGSKWFIAKPEDFEKIKSLKNIENSIISFNHYWVDEHTPIEAIDEETRKVTFKYRSRFTIEPVYEAARLRYIIENASESFKNPGEWYFDKAEHKLYYIPEMPMKADEVVGYIPKVSTIIKIEGKRENHARNITIRGFDIAYTKGDRILADGQETVFASDGQSVSETAAAIEIKYAYACAIEGCDLLCMGLHAIALRDGSVHNRITGNKIRESGAGGIVINSGMKDGWGEAVCDGIARDEGRYTYGNTVSDNSIIGVGRRYMAGCGVLIMHSYENTISHNEIADTCYTGISCGWVWGYKDSISHDNIIEKNHIHDIGGGALSDMGGIYLLGKQTGAIIRGNLIHDVKSAHYGGWALYADEGCGYVLFENNVCYNTSSNSFEQHYGVSNTVRNNIFAFSKDEPIANSRPELHLGTIYERNIIVSHGQEALKIGYHGEETGCLQVASYNNNIFFDTKTVEPVMLQIGDRKYSYKEYKEELDLDTGSICANPGFADIDNYDFTVSEDSPAVKMGFKPIDLSDVGPRY